VIPGKHIDDIGAMAARLSRPVKLMEVCGTHTVSAFRCGLRSLLPENVLLISGPGCPVCVTPVGYIDRAIAISRQPDTIIATFGDLLRVPGSESSLERERALGAALAIVYSPLEAVAEARRNTEKRVVFLGVGFETTAPTIAWSIKEAAQHGIGNYSVLCANKTMPQAMSALLNSGTVAIDGFLCPGHVSVIIGSNPYRFICTRFGIPCVVAGFEPQDMILSIEMLLRQKVEQRAEVEIQYSRAVDERGNAKAVALMLEVFEESEAEWRGLGVIPGSGLAIREEFEAHDAGKHFAGLEVPEPVENSGCICGAVLRGEKTPLDCRLFRKACTPTSPVGACMVSSEGTCAAYYKYAESAQ